MATYESPHKEYSFEKLAVIAVKGGVGTCSSSVARGHALAAIMTL